MSHRNSVANQTTCSSVNDHSSKSITMVEATRLAFVILKPMTLISLCHSDRREECLCVEVFQKMAYEAQDCAFLRYSCGSFDALHQPVRHHLHPSSLCANDRITTAAESPSIHRRLFSGLKDQHLRSFCGQRTVFFDFTHFEHVHAALTSAYKKTNRHSAC
jgi:hypothetical protein